MNDRYFDLGNLAANNEFDADAEAALLVAYFGASTPRRAARARAHEGDERLPRGDVGRRAAGASARSTSTTSRYADTHFDRLLRNASRPDYGRLLADAATPEPTIAGGPVQARAQIVIVGAGVAGASIAWHLAERGCTDVRRARARRTDERQHVSLGRTRRPAPFEPAVDADDDAQRRRVPAARGRSGARPAGRRAGARSGSLRIASTPARMEELRRQHGWAKTFGLPMELVSAGEAHERFPLMDPDRRARRRVAPDRRLPRPERAHVRVPRRRAQPRRHGRDRTRRVTDLVVTRRPRSRTSSPTAAPSRRSRSCSRAGCTRPTSPRSRASTFRSCRWRTST